MDRRSFLKLIGFGAAAAIVPFSIVDNVPKAPGKMLGYKRKLAAIENPTTDHKLIVIDNNGNNLWAPPIKSFTIEEGAVIFYAEDVNIDRSIILQGAKLLTPDGKLVAESEFAYPLGASRGDILKLTYRLSVS